MNRALLALILLCPAALAGEGVTVLLDDFENVGSGTKWVVVGVEGHDLKPEVAGLAEGGHDGRACAQVSVGAGSALAIRREFGKGFVGNGDKECLILPGRPARLGLWVKGNGTPTRLTIKAADATLDLGTLDFDGWRFLERDLPPAKKPPARLQEIHFDATKAQVVHKPDILLDDLTLVTEGTAEAPLFIEFERRGLAYELADGDFFAVRLRLQNLLPQPRKLKASVDLTTGKTAVMSHAETLKAQPFDVELAAGEAKSWEFEYHLSAGIYNGYLSLTDPATGGLVADRRIEYAVFPAAGATREKDFVVYNSGLSPFVLVRNAGPKLALFQGLEPYGLGGPKHSVYDYFFGKDEAWMLLYFEGANGWRGLKNVPYPIDVPILVVLEKKPVKGRRLGTGFELTFAESCGHVAIVPLYGVSYVREKETFEWTKQRRPPDSVMARCRLLAQVSREYPVALEESFKVDPVNDVVTIRDRFEFLSINDEWGTQHRKVAPIEYLTAMVNRSGWKPLKVDGKVLDLDMAVGQGLWAGVEGVNEYTYTLSGLLKYINLVEQPKTIPPDEPLLAEARKNFNVRNALWHRFHNSWWAEENLASAGSVGQVFPYLDPDAQRYARVAGRAVAAYTLNPNNLVFEYDAAKGVSYALDGQNYERMGWCDANATSNEALRAAYKYTVGTGDRDLVKQRWPFIRSFYNVPLKMSHWGDSAFNSGGGDTFGSNLNGTIAFARMAYWVGDDAAYKFACYHAAKQLLALYAVTTVYPKWVVEKDMWGTLQATFEARDEGGHVGLFATDVEKNGKEEKRTPRRVELRDIPFTDLRGGNVGIVPWCMVQRTSDPQERFLKDHAPDYSRYMINGLVEKWLPLWHMRVYERQANVPDWKALAALGERLPSWFRDSYGPSITPNLAGWDFIFDTPLPERRAKLERFLRNNGGLRGKEFDVILAGLEQTYKPLWEGGKAPRPDAQFRLGLQKVASAAANPALAIATPKFRWPTLVWHGIRSPEQPKVNSVGALPLCGIVPDAEKISFAAAADSPNWGLSTWGADYLDYPVLTFAAELEKLPLHLQSIVIEKGLDDAKDHVKNLLAQSELEWNVAGPFPYMQASDFDKVYPPEEKLDLAADYGTFAIGKDYHAKWQKARAKMYLIDFNKLYEPNCENYVQNAQVYAALWVRSPEERDLRLALGSDDGAKVWVNGTLVWKNWVHRGSAFDQDVFPIHLKKGWNAVLLKVFNRMYGCGFEFCARFVDSRLLPFGDLEFSSEPPK